MTKSSFMLITDFACGSETTSRVKERTLTEREANFLSASLLMPRKFLEADLQKQEDVDLLDDDFIRDLGKKYGVSTQALVNRLNNLGYIQE